MTQLLIWVLVVTGCTTIITQSSLFFPLREWLERSRLQSTYLSCPMCVGFAVGFVASALFKYSVVPPLTYWLGCQVLAPYWVIFQWVANGCASSMVCWTVYVGLKALGSDKL